jgi:glycosyltransferase involved in cell wall biosynthesis
MNVIVLSHLRWDFVFQRPQHLMTRCAQSNRVYFWEEPVFGSSTPTLHLEHPGPGLYRVVPQLPTGLGEDEHWLLQEELLRKMVEEHSLQDHVLWYYTPMAVHFTRKLSPAVVVYDCMDELSAFRGAPPGLRAAEAELFAKADLIFTGGQSLYRAKQNHHPSVHCFPSSIDRKFFSTARRIKTEPEDQANIPRPRLGYCGVIDERMDVDLIGAVAQARPDWHFVMVGPVVKISDSDLPHLPNIHYLGAKQYRDLPSYMSGWDVGLLPFARNESTRFISPTKTPEYLAAGLPVVSTSITDVVDPYGREGLVAIVATPDEFIQSISAALPRRNCPQRLVEADRFLSGMSWDATWSRMFHLIQAARRERASSQVARTPAALLVQPQPAAGD